MILIFKILHIENDVWACKYRRKTITTLTIEKNISTFELTIRLNLNSNIKKSIIRKKMEVF